METIPFQDKGDKLKEHFRFKLKQVDYKYKDKLQI